MTGRDTHFLVCHPIGTLPEPTVGSIEQWCTICSQGVWVAQSSRQLMKQHPDMQIVCNDCVEGVMGTLDEPVKVLPVNEREARATAADEAAYQRTLRHWKQKLERQ